MEFFGLSFSRRELLDLYQALVQRAFVEDDLRYQKGLEPVDVRPFIDRIEFLLNLNKKQVEDMTTHLEEELWEHTWFGFSEEWVWWRAKQAVRQELKRTNQTVSPAEFSRLVDLKYQKEFDRFIQEIEMKDLPEVGKKRKAPSKPKG